jgi:hypothetical protein
VPSADAAPAVPSSAPTAISETTAVLVLDAAGIRVLDVLDMLNSSSFRGRLPARPES